MDGSQRSLGLTISGEWPVRPRRSDRRAALPISDRVDQPMPGGLVTAGRVFESEHEAIPSSAG
jgi:hypothetical protein